MKIATVATMWFAVAFASAITPAETAFRPVPPQLQAIDETNLYTDHLLTGPDLMLVPYDAGILGA